MFLESELGLLGIGVRGRGFRSDDCLTLFAETGLDSDLWPQECDAGLEALLRARHPVD